MLLIERSSQHSRLFKDKRIIDQIYVSLMKGPDTIDTRNKGWSKGLTEYELFAT